MERWRGRSNGARICARASAGCRPIATAASASNSKSASSDGVEFAPMGHAEHHSELEGRVAAHFAASADLKRAAAQVLAAPIARAASLMATTLSGGGKVLACGNGGSP